MNDIKQTFCSPLGIVCGCIGFIVLGAVQAIYGPIIPELKSHFGISSDIVALLLSVQFFGAILGVFMFNAAMKYWTNRSLISASYILAIVGMLIVAFANWFEAKLMGALLIGLGFGGIDFGLNYFFSIGFGSRSAALVNLLNAFFGVGSVLAPAVIGLFGAEHYTTVFMALALLAIFAWLGSSSYSNNTGHIVKHEAHDSKATHRPVYKALMCSFFSIFIFHVAVETGIGGWGITHLISQSHSFEVSAFTISGFWLSMTLGRFLTVPLSLAISSRTIMLISSLGLIISALFTAHTDWSALAYLAAGFFIAPMFPTGLVWLGQLIPGKRITAVWVIALSMIGGVIFPYLIGLSANSFGYHSIPIILVALSILCFMATLHVAFVNSQNGKRSGEN